MNNQSEILRLKKLAGLLSESQINELGMKDLGVGAALAASSLFGSPEVKAQMPQQIVQQATNDIDITSSKAVKNISKQGYETIVGGLPLEASINKLQDMIQKGFKIVQGKAVGQTQTAAKMSATEKAKSKLEGQVIPTNIVLKKTLDNGNTEVIVFLATK